MANVTHYEDILMPRLYKCYAMFEEYKNLIKDLFLKKANIKDFSYDHIFF